MILGFEHLTDHARIALQLASDESTRLNHIVLDTEHLLFGILKEGQGLAALTLRRQGLEPDSIMKRLTDRMKSYPEPSPFWGERPFTLESKEILMRSFKEAEDGNPRHVGTEHMLLGILYVNKGLAAAVLCEAGLTYEACKSILRANPKRLEI